MAKNENNKEGVFLAPPRQTATVVSGIADYLTVRDGSRPYETATGPNKATFEKQKKASWQPENTRPKA
jgi:hypothetical protein